MVEPKLTEIFQTLLDVSEHHAVRKVAEADLSVDEDSPQTISSLTTKQGLITLAGISSSSADQKAGTNEHLRIFNIEFPPRKRARKDDGGDEAVPLAKQARLTPVGKSQLFKPNPSTFRNPRTYQRLMRLSPVKSRDVASKRIGAIGTADAAQNEIVLFDATMFIPNASSVLQRLTLDSEAEDLDLFEDAPASFALAYCTNYTVHLYRLSCDFDRKSSTPIDKTPLLLHSITPKPGTAAPKIRCLRWISPSHLILLQNTLNSAPELLILHLDPANGASRIIQRKPLPRSLGMGVRLAICPLDADPASGLRQIVVAVAGQNKSIHIYTTNHDPSLPSDTDRVSPLTTFSVLDTSAQHPQSISKLAFSNFFPPKQAPDNPSSVASETQYIQLASVSVGWTVSVETFALTSTPTRPALTSSDPISNEKAQATNRPSVRWVLSSASGEFIKSWAGVMTAGVVVLAVAMLIQAYLSASGAESAGGRAGGIKSLTRAPPLSGFLSRAQEFAGAATGSAASATISEVNVASGVLEDVTATVSSAAAEASMRTRHQLSNLRDLLHLHKHDLLPLNPYAAPSKAILLNAPATDAEKATPAISAEVHHDGQSVEELRRKGAKRFEELSVREKERWMHRLQEAGQWSEAEGVKVLKGVLFSQWAEVVGGALRDAALG